MFTHVDQWVLVWFGCCCLAVVWLFAACRSYCVRLRASRMITMGRSLFQAAAAKFIGIAEIENIGIKIFVCALRSRKYRWDFWAWLHSIATKVQPIEYFRMMIWDAN